MTTTTETPSTIEGLHDSLSQLHYAGCGIWIIRTNEERLAIKALDQLADELELPFTCWDIKDGFTVPGQPVPSVEDRITIPVDALDHIAEMQSVEGTGRLEIKEQLVAFCDMHELFGENGLLIRRYIKEYSVRFSSNELRVIFIVPLGFQIPSDLETIVTIVDFGLPTMSDFRKLLEDITTASLVDENGERLPNAANPFEEEDQNRICAALTGMTTPEAENALGLAIVDQEDWPENLDLDRFCSVAMEQKSQVVKRSEILEVMDPVPMDEVGGLEYLKEWIGERRHYFSEEAQEFGADRPKGMLVIGQPGTGKSLVAKATADALGFPLIKADISRFFGSLVGETESRVRQTLLQLQAMAPCVAFLDEIDKSGLNPNGHQGDSGVSQRVLGQILTFMQENKKPIFWVLSANRIEALPPELLRKGRVDELWYVAAPTAPERAEILQIHLRKRKQAPAKVKGLEDVLECSRGYTGAEIEHAVAEAVGKAFITKKKHVTGEMICQQLALIKPVSVAFKKEVGTMKAWAENNARPASHATEEKSLGNIEARKEEVKNRVVRNRRPRKKAEDQD